LRLPCVTGDGKCPPAFDCNGVAPEFWHPNTFL